MVSFNLGYIISKLLCGLCPRLLDQCWVFIQLEDYFECFLLNLSIQPYYNGLLNVRTQLTLLNLVQKMHPFQEENKHNNNPKWKDLDLADGAHGTWGFPETSANDALNMFCRSNINSLCVENVHDHIIKVILPDLAKTTNTEVLIILQLFCITRICFSMVLKLMHGIGSRYSTRRKTLIMWILTRSRWQTI